MLVTVQNDLNNIHIPLGYPEKPIMLLTSIKIRIIRFILSAFQNIQGYKSLKNLKSQEKCQSELNKYAVYKNH